MATPELDQSFRDSMGTVTEEGKRNWVFPKKPHGKFYKYRSYVSYGLLAFLFLAPFIKVNGNQFLLFNILERKFVLFGFAFFPHDFHLFVIGMITTVVFVILFTVIYGRLFCGWICPQTIFMEMLFRKIEYAIDGDRGAQIRLKKQAWNAEKIRKRTLKHSIFFIISFLIANVFLSYIIGSDALIEIVTDHPKNHLVGLIAILLFTTVFYFVFSWFREQVCIVVCPYGRLQGVLLDRKSIVVGYDYVRGEGENGRAKFRKNEDRKAEGKGDCIDCGHCVHVCPTGIDIRNGTQLECINCTACIDACDAMMEKVDLPKGLIRYASEQDLADNEKPKFTTRMKAYTAVLFALIGVLITLMVLRAEVEAVVLRLPGQLYQEVEDNRIQNVYTYRLINKTNNDRALRVALISHEGEVEIVGHTVLDVPAEGQAQGSMFIRIPRAQLDKGKTDVKLGFYDGEQLVEVSKITFNSPRY